MNREMTWVCFVVSVVCAVIDVCAFVVTHDTEWLGCTLVSLIAVMLNAIVLDEANE